MPEIAQNGALQPAVGAGEGQVEQSGDYRNIKTTDLGDWP
jgi:hypothetical protein